MTNRLDLPLRYREQLDALLCQHVPGIEVWAYGSRVNGRSHEGSDLDLVLRSPTLEPLGCEYLELVEALEQSNIPILVQAHDWARLPESFHREIERDYAVVQKRDHQTVLEGWRKVALGDVCTKIGSGATPRGGKDVYLDEGPYTLIRSQNVYNDGFHRDGLAFIGEGHASELQNVEVFEEDVLLNITGDSVARVCQVAPDVLPARVNQHVAIIRPDSINLEAGYLRYYLASPDMQAMLLSWAGSGGTRNALTKGMMQSLEIPLPPLAEQRAIAGILGALDDKIELNRRMNETLEQMARALFQSWFVDFDPVRAKMSGRETSLPPELWALFPDRLVDSELGKIPEGWAVKALGELIELAYGKALKAGDRKGGDVPVFGSNGQVGWHDEKLAAGPGIVVGRKGNPGVVAWSHTDFFPIDTAFYVVPAMETTSLHFLFYALTGQDLPSVAADSAVPGLNRNLAYMNRQLVPCGRIAEAFGNYAAMMFARRHRLEEESRALAAQRNALLPKLVSGELKLGIQQSD